MSADFGEEGGRHDWWSHEEVVKWIDQLQQQWDWLQRQKHNPPRNAWQAIANTLSNAKQNLQQALNSVNQGQMQNAENNIASARAVLEGFVRPNPWLLSGSAQRKFVEELRDGGMPLEAALIVCHWLKQDLGGPQINFIVSALLQWELYERGIKDRMKTENAALKRLVGEMQSTLTQYQDAEHTQTSRFDELHGQIAEQSAKQQGAFDTAQQTRDTAWEELLNHTQAELNTLKETYDKHMALAAPVEYWDTKRKKHRLWSGISFGAIVAGMGGAAYFLHSELQSVGQAVLASKAVETATTAQVAGTTTMQALTDSATTWHLGSFILLATLSFWFIRLLVRIFLSNLHLENDAAERVTMAKTYLALIRNDDLPKGDNISTVLAALFRPTGDGIVKDEGVPPSTLEWFTKLGR
ncbi:MAG: hypothetical protein A2X71_09360 [Thiobacillus sp. GWE1_62_9]|nr:MAG: hypothetical protein A2X71_09360 [Thiobacillus sp. GWE1_62_9]HBU30143.1 hypothetical protein [Thiobacillus sp.]